jgi:hypothetical protein
MAREPIQDARHLFPRQLHGPMQHCRHNFRQPMSPYRILGIFYLGISMGPHYTVGFLFLSSFMGPRSTIVTFFLGSSMQGSMGPCRILGTFFLGSSMSSHYIISSALFSSPHLNGPTLHFSHFFYSWAHVIFHYTIGRIADYFFLSHST